jgi:hypothetical protein
MGKDETTATSANKVDIEHERLELERRKFELEERKLEYAKAIDEKKLKSDSVAKRWSQFSVFVPIIILLAGFFLNSCSERLKREQTQREDLIKQKRQYIEKQLSEFYYPIQLRLHKDNAIFDIWNKNHGSEEDNKLSKQLEDNFVIPNHEEIIKIIDAHFELIKNETDDEKKIAPLMKAMKDYESHVAVYKALKDTGDNRKPIQLNEPFPKEFFRLIEVRIAELENKRDDLLP